MATNQYEAELENELIWDCGEEITRADWCEFHDALKEVDDRAKESALSIVLLPKDEQEQAIEDDVEFIAKCVENTRANLPSLEKYIWQQIENEIKEIEG